MTEDTRTQFLAAAESLFAERGFDGVSIAAIADELGLTKQALLHHFGSKEKLYGQVLERISAQFEALDTGALDGETDPAAAFTQFLMRVYMLATEHPDLVRLLMRELLDNRQRADTAGTWYLKPFLQRLTDMAGELDGWQDTNEAQRLALVYQLLGAINYFGVSEATLTGIYSQRRFSQIKRVFPAQLETLIEAAIAPAH